MLVLWVAAYFIFKVTEATLLDTPSCIPEVAEVHSSILFDLLVVLAMVFVAMAPGSPKRGSNWSAKRL